MPRNTKELLEYLKENRLGPYEKNGGESDARAKEMQSDLDKFIHKGAQKAARTLFREKTMPMEFSRLEFNGGEVRSIVFYHCAHCGTGGVSTSQDDDGTLLSCWHCNTCDGHCTFRAITKPI